MRPVLVELAGVEIAAYPLLLAAGACVLIAVGVAVAERRRLPGHHVAVVLALGYAGGLLGARLAWVAQDWRAFDDPLAALLAPRPGGFALYGGLVGGAVAAAACAAALRLPAGRVADAGVLGLGLAAAIGRLGCLLAGCCYGRPTAWPWGIVFPEGSPAAQRWGEGVAVHPTQLYEAAALAGLAVVCHRIGRDRRPAGQGFAALVLGYSALRLLGELARGDATPALFGLTAGQWISLALAVAAGSFLAAVAWRGRTPRRLSPPRACHDPIR